MRVPRAGPFVTPAGPRGGRTAAPQPRRGSARALESARRFGLAPFRSPLLGGSLLFSSPPATWMFRFAGFAPASWPVPCLRTAGYPIRAPADHRPLAPPRGISPPAAPFIASGSHRHPPCALSRLSRPALPRQTPARMCRGARGSRRKRTRSTRSAAARRAHWRAARLAFLPSCQRSGAD